MMIAVLAREARYGAGFAAAVFSLLTTFRQAADTLIGVSCSAVIVRLALVFYKARAGRVFKWIIALFGLLAVTGGGIYLLNVPAVGKRPLPFADAVRLVTAVASFIAAVYLPPLVGRVHAMLGRVNRAEQRQIEVDTATRELKERETLVTRREGSREHQYRFLADFMPQIVWTAKPDGSFDYYNKRWYGLTGDVRKEEKYACDGDQNWSFVLHKDDVERCHDRWYKAVRTGERYEIEYRLLDSRAGQYRWFLGRARPKRDDHGQIVKSFGNCTDIDDQRRVQRDLREIRDQLEERVQQRTADLTKVNEC
jgi:PAS domain S-box-containing protein